MADRADIDHHTRGNMYIILKDSRISLKISELNQELTHLLIKRITKTIETCFIEICKKFNKHYRNESHASTKAFAVICENLQENKFLFNNINHGNKTLIKNIVKKWAFFIQIVDEIHPNVKQQYPIQQLLDLI